MQTERETRIPLVMKLLGIAVFVLIFYFACEFRHSEKEFSCSAHGISDQPDITKAEFWVWKRSLPQSKSEKPGCQLAARKVVFDGFGNQESKQVRLLTELKNDILNPVAEILPSGNLLIAWMQREINGEMNVFCRTFTNNLVPISQEIRLNESGETIDASGMDVRYISSQEAVVVWGAQSNDGTQNLSIRVVNVEEEVVGILLNINYWGKIRNPQICNSGMGYAISFISESNLPVVAFFNRFHVFQNEVNLASDMPKRKDFFNVQINYDHALNRYIAFFASSNNLLFFRTIGNSSDLGEITEYEIPANEKIMVNLPFMLSVQQTCICARYLLLFHVNETMGTESISAIRMKKLTIDRRIDRELSSMVVETVGIDSLQNSLVSTCIFPSRTGFTVLTNEFKPDSCTSKTSNEGRILSLFLK